MKYRVTLRDRSSDHIVRAESQNVLIVESDGRELRFAFEASPDGRLRVTGPDGTRALYFAAREQDWWLHAGSQRLAARVERLRPSTAAEASVRDAGEVRTPMAGKLVRLLVSAGQSVAAGTPLAVIEAMKMENELLAPFAGVVRELPLSAPSAIEKGALVVRLEAS